MLVRLLEGLRGVGEVVVVQFEEGNWRDGSSWELIWIGKSLTSLLQVGRYSCRVEVCGGSCRDKSVVGKSVDVIPRLF